MRPAALVDAVRRLPEESRTYTCDEHAARVHFGLDEPTLRDLVAQGLPHRDDGGGMRFEHGDLHYVGLRLGRAATFAWTAQQWAQSLERFAGAAATRVSIDYVPELGADAGPTAGSVVLPSGERRSVVLRHGDPAATVEVVLHGSDALLPREAARVVHDVAARLDFYQLPPALQGDTALARRIGLADCRTAAHLVVEEWLAEGLEARVSHGFFVSVPFSIFHAWAEVRTDGDWMSADPLMLVAMRDFGGLDRDRWPLHRSPGPALSRIEGAFEAAMATPDRPVRATLLSRISGEQ